MLLCLALLWVRPETKLQSLGSFIAKRGFVGEGIGRIGCLQLLDLISLYLGKVRWRKQKTYRVVNIVQVIIEIFELRFLGTKKLFVVRGHWFLRTVQIFECVR